MMLKLVGFMLSMVVLAQSASAALLASYNFNTDANTSFTAVGVTGTAVSGAGSLQVPKWNPGSASGSSYVQTGWSTFSVSSTPNMSVSNVSFNYATNGTGAAQGVVAEYSFTNNGTDWLALSGSPMTAPGLGASTGVVYVRFAGFAAGLGAVSVNMTIDEILVNGSNVPEPASAAIFGAVGLGFVVRRMRRRK